MNFEQIKSFYTKHYLIPYQEEGSSHDEGISEEAFVSMLEEAKSLDEDFYRFAGHFYDWSDEDWWLAFETWDDLKEAWENWSKN